MKSGSGTSSLTCCQGSGGGASASTASSCAKAMLAKSEAAAPARAILVNIWNASFLACSHETFVTYALGCAGAEKVLDNSSKAASAGPDITEP